MSVFPLSHRVSLQCPIFIGFTGIAQVGLKGTAYLHLPGVRIIGMNHSIQLNHGILTFPC